MTQSVEETHTHTRHTKYAELKSNTHNYAPSAHVNSGRRAYARTRKRTHECRSIFRLLSGKLQNAQRKGSASYHAVLQEKHFTFCSFMSLSLFTRCGHRLCGPHE